MVQQTKIKIFSNFEHFLISIQEETMGNFQRAIPRCFVVKRQELSSTKRKKNYLSIIKDFPKRLSNNLLMVILKLKLVPRRLELQGKSKLIETIVANFQIWEILLKLLKLEMLFLLIIKWRLFKKYLILSWIVL